jgi:hypothetical protein
MNEIKYLSPSKISALQMCGEEFRLNYVEGIPKRSSGTFHFGKVVHALMENALRQVILGNKLPSAKDMTDTVKDVWDKVWAEEEKREKFIGWEWNEDDSPEKAFADVAPLITVARNEVLPTIKPVHVEHGWNVHLDDEGGEPFRIYGVIDLLEQGGLVTDWKTANGKVSQFARKHDVQIDAYGYWVNQYMKLDVVSMRKVFLIRSKRPGIDCEKYEVGPTHRARFEQAARAAWRMIKAEAYLANPNTWKCSEKFCSYWNICPFGGATKETEV